MENRRFSIAFQILAVYVSDQGGAQGHLDWLQQNKKTYKNTAHRAFARLEMLSPLTKRNLASPAGRFGAPFVRCLYLTDDEYARITCTVCL